MSKKRFTQEFKDEAVRLIRERNYSVAETSKRLGVSVHSLYKWLGGQKVHKQEQNQAVLQSENLRLKKALLRAEEERDILKKAAAYFAKECR
jgi:transposase